MEKSTQNGVEHFILDNLQFLSDYDVGNSLDIMSLSQNSVISKLRNFATNSHCWGSAIID